MATQRVRATREGYYNHERVKEGREFSMDEKFMKKDPKDKTGKAVILPSWVESAAKPPKTAEKEVESEPGTSQGSGQGVI